VTVVLTGTVTLGEVAMFLESQREQDAWTYSVLYDAHDATVDLPDTDLADLAAHLQTLNRPRPRGPVAVVGTDDRLRTVVERFASLVKPMGLAIGFFRDLQTASRWLDEHVPT